MRHSVSAGDGKQASRPQPSIWRRLLVVASLLILGSAFMYARASRNPRRISSAETILALQCAWLSNASPYVSPDLKW
jgi:hypothetical protein